MAVTYGFYNSLNKDRMYNAEQMSAIFDGIITDGVFGAIGDKLMPVAGTGMQVIVKTGKCWFNSTWTLNDAQLPLDVEAADVSLTRIDAVVVEINSAVGTRANSIKVIKGTPSANPAKPTLSATETLHQYALGYITVAAGVTAITAANIEVNVGKATCPFITSVLQQTDITDLFNQWNAEFSTWFANVQSQLSGDIAANLQRQIDENKRLINEHWANTLKDSTKTAMGLAKSSVPDDAFNYLYVFTQAVIPAGYGILIATVKDQDDKPVPGAIVYVYSASPVSLVSTLTSDTNGIVQVNLAPGAYTLLMDNAPDFFSYSAVNITVAEKKLTTATINVTLMKSGKIYVTESKTLEIPAWIEKYDLFGVGGGGGGCTGYGVRGSSDMPSGTIVAMAGGGGGLTKTLLNATARKLGITIGAGGLGGIVPSTSYRGPTPGSDGGNTIIKDSESNTVLLRANGGYRGMGTYNTPSMELRFDHDDFPSGSAGGYPWQSGRSSDDDGYSLRGVVCTAGREDGASAYPIQSGEDLYHKNTPNENYMPAGQGTTTREFGEPTGELYASGAGAVLKYPGYDKISASGTGAGISSYGPTFTTSQENQACDATTYGSGGGCTYSGTVKNQRGGNGKQGVVVLRWDLEAT